MLAGKVRAGLAVWGVLALFSLATALLLPTAMLAADIDFYHVADSARQMLVGGRKVGDRGGGGWTPGLAQVALEAIRAAAAARRPASGGQAGGGAGGQ